MSHWSYEPRRRRPVAPKAGWSPVVVEGRAIARSFWGRAWCDNLESYADFANRLPRGRTYVRQGAVVDLGVEPGVVSARVAGSSLYTTTVDVAALAPERWDAIVAAHARGIASVVSLLEGTLPRSLLDALANPASGLFPTPKDLRFRCSCPDWASMCKHVAAVLYGVGARLDSQPDLFFRLRGVEVGDLAARGGAVTFDGPPGDDALVDADLSALFGIDLGEGAAMPAASAVPTAARPEARTKPTAARKAQGGPKPKAAAKAIASPAVKPAAKAKGAKKPEASAKSRAAVEPNDVATPKSAAKSKKTPKSRAAERSKPAAKAKEVAASSPARRAALAAMIEEACVDAHGPHEQVTGLYTMLEEHLDLPLEAMLLGDPLRVCALAITDDATILALCLRGGRTLRVGLESITLPVRAGWAADWIAAYTQWLRGA